MTTTLDTHYEQKVERAYQELIEKLRSAIDESALMTATQSGQIDTTAEALGLLPDDFPAFDTASESLSDALDSIAEAAAITAAAALSFRFIFSPDDNLKARHTTFLADLKIDIRKAVAVAMQFQLALGGDPQKAVARIVKFIGLSEKQITSLTALERALTGILNKTVTELSPYITRTLSASQRSILSKALKKGITPDDIDRILERQADHLHKLRAKSISITETTRFINAGQQAAWEQAISRNIINPALYRRFWVTAGDERVRFSHSATQNMNAKGVGISEPFRTPLGPVMYPPLEINCRCRVALRKVRK